MNKSEKASSSAKSKFSGRSKAIAGVVVAVVVIAVVAAVAYFVTKVPDNAAAKLNNDYIYEDTVTEWIQTYRQNYSLTDDDEFADFLSAYDQTPADFRESAINEIATRELVRQRADEMGITVTDDEVQEYYDSIMGENDTSEGSLMSQVMQAAGLTEEILKDRYRYNILQQKVLQANVDYRDATDDETLAYVKDTLAGSTQMHLSHIVFSGDNALERAQDCYNTLNAAKSEGTLDANSFAAAAKEYSDEEDVATTGGAIGWTGCGQFSTGVLNALSGDEEGEIGKGDLMEPVESSEDSGVYEVAYIDDTFSFGQAEDMQDLASLNMPSELLDVVRLNAQLTAYQDDCVAYLSSLVSAATIEYYPMPSDVPYNVSMS